MNIGISRKGVWIRTTVQIVILLKIVVKHQVFDALLFFTLSLLLILHSNRKGRI